MKTFTIFKWALVFLLLLFITFYTFRNIPLNNSNSSITGAVVGMNEDDQPDAIIINDSTSGESDDDTPDETVEIEADENLLDALKNVVGTDTFIVSG